MIEQLKKFLEIDKLSLDDEIIRQPSLFYSVSEAYVAAVGERDTLKEQLASTDAEIDGEIRSNAKTRVTDTAVKNLVQCDKDHEKAFKAYIAAKVKADQLGALKEAFQQRGYLLRDLASLYVANYFDHSSIQGTSSQDKTIYEARRRTLAEARQRRDDT
jgi:hypothetical protein